MVFHAVSRQALRTAASATASRLPAASAAASVGSSPPKSSHSNSSSPSSSSTAPQQKNAAPSSEPEQAGVDSNLNRNSSSLFDIDTSATPLASQLIEAEEAASKDEAGKTGAKPKTGARSMSSIEKKRQTTARLFGGLILVGAGLGAYNLGRPWDNDAERERFKDQSGNDNLFGRMKLRLSAMYEDFNKPVFEQLLPDPLPFPYSRPYTMVVDLDDLLVHSEWSREHGWRTAKRPGLDYFLGYLSQFYEIVLFTTQPFFTAGPIIEKLDPDRRFVAYTLFRESCRTVDGKPVKDLNYLNRDQSKVVVLDTNPDSFALHPQNGVLIKPWKGDRQDRELVGLIPFFEAIGIYGIDDVRNTIKAYEGTHIPTEHAKRANAIREQELSENRARAERLGKIGSIFGGVSRNAQPHLPADKTMYDLERERFVQGYLEDQKYWKENGEALRKQAKDEQERQIREMKMNTWSFLTGGAKPPTDSPEQPKA
ncbi:NIF-domain-containing protein [Testicularia cyperi]|uniref:Mitochondrial import inner membrane translocase subunit TIM50 n=1 Tax=Testicularia cyperi TaxID=1882483 RepID=A0A317XZH9_9BASI|nr:NIF-domain-containing protein [Testicularia cyperi]